MLTEPESESE